MVGNKQTKSNFQLNLREQELLSFKLSLRLKSLRLVALATFSLPVVLLLDTYFLLLGGKEAKRMKVYIDE